LSTTQYEYQPPAPYYPPSPYLGRPSPSSLRDVLELILDRGLVIDIFVRVSLVGIELLTIDARIVVASVDTYLKFAREVNRLELPRAEPRVPGAAGQVTEGLAGSTAPGVSLAGQGEQAPTQKSRPEQEK
jgi:gas vesicle structural protein